MRAWNPILLHPVLAVLFPVLFLYHHNQSQVIPLTDVAGGALMAAAVAAGAWFILSRVIGDAGRAALVTSLTGVLVLSYGHVTMAIADLLHRYTPLATPPDAPWFLVPWLLVLAGGCRAILRARGDLAPVHKTVTLVTAGLVASSGMGIALAEAPDASAALADPVDDAPVDEAGLPDIYLIVLDEYGSTRQLADAHGFDNTPFEDALRARGFRVPRESRANYPMTFLSLASTLNMRYLDDVPAAVGEDATDRRVPYGMIEHNAVATFLASHGYDIVHFDSGWSGTAGSALADHVVSCGRLSEFTRTLVETTILQLAHARLVEGDMRERVDCQFRELVELPAARADAARPAFVFAHIVSPHEPFVFDAEGAPVNGTRVLATAEDPRAARADLYLDQLQHVNTRVLDVVDAIIAADPDAVVIVQSDHGTNLLDGWLAHDEAFMRDRLRNFNALRLPGAPAGTVPENVTNVNTFRLVLPAYFEDADLAPLPDRTYFSDPFAPYAFTDVTNVTAYP